MRILVCGGREFDDYWTVKNILGKVIMDFRADDTSTKIILIEGGAKGADFLAKVYFLEGIRHGDCNWSVESYPADWKKYGSRAGPIRNQQMLDEGKPDLVVAFPGGSGTKDMIARAKKSGVEVLEV